MTISMCSMSSVNPQPTVSGHKFRHLSPRAPRCPVHTVEENCQGDGGHSGSKNHGPPHAIDAQF